MDIKKLYFDMDGVLADFDRGLTEICGITPVDQSKAAPQDEEVTFGAIREADHFYRRLELIEGAREMFDTLYGLLGNKCEILTGIPNPKRNIPEASEDKKEWVREKLSDKIKVHAIRRSGKKKFCKGPEYILIDDYRKNIDEWRECGGTGILFENAKQALKEVLKLMEDKGKEKGMEEKKETKEIRYIHPMSSVNIDEILERWNDSFNEDISNPTDQWHLVASPIMAGARTTQAALIFRQRTELPDGGGSCLNKYRVLLYDMTVTPLLVNSSEFQFRDWELKTAWFFNNRLFVCMRDENMEYDVISVRGSGNERIVSLGHFVTSVCANTRGDIVCGYDCCDDLDDRREPLILFVRNGENKSLMSDDAISCECICVDAKDTLWAYVKPYNYISHMDGDDYETFPVSLSGFSGIGVSDDGKMLLASMDYRYFGSRLYVFRRNEDDRFCDEVEVRLATGDDEVCISSVTFGGNKAVIRTGSMLHMININELTWEDTETAELGKKDDSRENNGNSGK